MWAHTAAIGSKGLIKRGGGGGGGGGVKYGMSTDTGTETTNITAPINT